MFGWFSDKSIFTSLLIGIAAPASQSRYEVSFGAFFQNTECMRKIVLYYPGRQKPVRLRRGSGITKQR